MCLLFEKHLIKYAIQDDWQCKGLGYERFFKFYFTCYSIIFSEMEVRPILLHCSTLKFTSFPSIRVSQLLPPESVHTGSVEPVLLTITSRVTITVLNISTCTVRALHLHRLSSAKCLKLCDLTSLRSLYTRTSMIHYRH